VELNFAGVRRVNSMGLAQLLKLFEHWQGNHISIRVSQANRMTAMLFKMTGLDRFLVAEAPARAASAGSAPPAAGPRPAPARPPAAPAAPVSSPPQSSAVSPSAPRPTPAVAPLAFGGVETRPASPRPTASEPPATAASPLQWQVSMQSSQEMNGWYFLNTHLQRRLSLTARLGFADNLLGSRETDAGAPELIYGRPFDAIRLITRRGFRPLARPSNQSDEVTILARTDDERQAVAEFAGSRAVAASRESFVYLLGRYLLDDAGIPSESMQYRFSGHEIKAVQMLLKREADLLFMHSENYQRLSGMTRRMLKELDHSEAQFAFHLWCLSPSRAELGQSLQNFLLSMAADAQGRKILQELGCTAWVEPAAEDIAMLERIYTIYGG
jgi:hypothetical protein